MPATGRPDRWNRNTASLAAGVRRQHQQGAVQPARPPQRAVHVPRMVGRGQHEHPVVPAGDGVELEQQLVDRAAHRRAAQLAAALPERVDLVQEQHRGRAARAVANSSLMLRSLCPVYMSMTSANETVMKLAPSSSASALAMNVLPQPGGP